MRFRTFAFLTAVLATTLASAAADAEVSEAPLADRIIDNQLKALSDLLASDLQQTMAQHQQHWVAYRDEQCRLELALARGQGKTSLREDAGRDVGCINRLNRQRLGELQRYLAAFLASISRPTTQADDSVPKE